MTGAASAQVTSVPPSPAEGSPAGPAVSVPGRLVPAEPDTFYLIDENGKLIPYFGMPFEEFEQVFRLYKDLKQPEQAQQFILQELSIEGTAGRQQAELQLSLRVLTRIDGWVRVPLRLDGLVIHPGTGDNQEAGDHFLEISHEGDGLGCWIRGKPDTVHQIQFHALARTVTTGETTRLSLNCPTATVSQIRLRVPEENVDAEVGSGPLIRDVRRIDDDLTEISVLGLGERFELTWRPVSGDQQRTAPPLQVNGEILVTLRGQHRLSCVADLTVSSPRVPFDSFVVRLPAGMEFLKVDQPNEARLLSASEAKGLSSIEGQLIEIRLPSRSNEQRQVRIAAREQQTESAAGDLLELAGFEVLGAPFQTGSLNVKVEDDWTFQPYEGQSIRRVEGISNLLRRTGVVARFVYDTQPCSLKVQVSARQQRVRIESHYDLFIEEDHVDLVARLNCQLRGAKTESIRVDMSGWVIDDIDQTRLIDRGITQLDSVSPLVIHLATSAVPVGGQFDLTVRAHRAMDDEARQEQIWALPIPRAVASTVVPASVAVYSTENVVLTPLMERIRGLLLDPTASVADPGRSVEPDWVYREQTERLPAAPEETGDGVNGEKTNRQPPPDDATTVSDSSPVVGSADTDSSSELPSFVCRYDIRELELSATVAGKVVPVDRSLQIQHEITWNVQYGQIDHLLLDVPKLTQGDDQLSITLRGLPANDQTLSWQESSASQLEASQADSWRRLRVELPEERSGTFQIVVTQILYPGNVSSEGSVEQPVPMVRPSGPEPIDVSLARLEIQSSDTLLIRPAGEQWRESEIEQDEDPTLLVIDLASATLDGPLRLRLTTAQVENLGATVVERAWVQSVVFGEDRQERVAMKVATNERHLQLQIPSDARDLELAVDGHRVAHSKLADTPGEINVALPRVEGKTDYVLELWYGIANQSTNPSHHLVDVPQIKGARWTKHFYWQLVLPQDEHLIVTPEGLTPESRWTWQGFYWSWQSKLTQRDLEQWTEASQQTLLPAATNQYVFSSFAPVDRIDCTSADRRSIMFVIATITLAVGLALIYFPQLRHPASLFMFALVLAFVSVVYPEPTMLVAQVASLGLIFTLIGQMLRTTMAHQQVGRPVVRGTSRSSAESVTDAAEVIPHDGGSTASGGSLVIHVNEPGSH